MKKSKLWLALVGLFILLVGAGCSNNSANSTKSDSNYTSLMSQGKDYVADKEYSQAQNKFNDAHNAKATAEAKTYAKQAGNMVDVQDEISEYNFKAALKKLDKVINADNGYSVMNNQAKKLDKKISKVQDNLTNEVNPLYKQAKAAYQDNNYDNAVSLCQQILDLSYINGKYYQEAKNDTKDLLAQAKAKAKTNSSANNNSTDTNSNNSNSSNQSSSNSSNSSSSSNNMTVGGQAVPERVVAQVRNQLSSLGVNTSSWSDQDIVNFMNAAAKNGHTTIDSYDKNDVNSFQK